MECFTGSHLVLAIFAILVLTLCMILIIIVIMINTGKLKVCMSIVCEFHYCNNFILATLFLMHDCVISLSTTALNTRD